MPITLSRPRVADPTYDRPTREREALLADALGCIIAGRPLPAALRPTVLAAARPATVEDGLTAILAGPTARRG